LDHFGFLSIAHCYLQKKKEIITNCFRFTFEKTTSSKPFFHRKGFVFSISPSRVYQNRGPRMLSKMFSVLIAVQQFE
jgi:hypothetical protein